MRIRIECPNSTYRRMTHANTSKGKRCKHCGKRHRITVKEKR